MAYTRASDVGWVQGWLEGRVEHPAPTNDQMVHVAHRRNPGDFDRHPTIGFAHGRSAYENIPIRDPNRAHFNHDTRVIYSGKYAIEDPVDAMPHARVRAELNRMGVRTDHQSEAAQRSQLRLVVSDQPTAQTTRVPPSLSSNAMTGAIAYGNAKSNTDNTAFTSDGITIVDDRNKDLHPDMATLQHELRVLQAANFELNLENTRLKESHSDSSELLAEATQLRREKEQIQAQSAAENAKLYEELQAASASGGNTDALRREIVQLQQEKAQLTQAKADANTDKAEWMSKAADEQAVKHQLQQDLASLTAELIKANDANSRLTVDLERAKAAADTQAKADANTDEKARLQQQITTLEADNMALKSAAGGASDASAAENTRLKQQVASLEADVHRLENTAPSPGDHMQLDLKQLGLKPEVFKFGRRIYQCNIPAPGVGYRNTPEFPDKNPNATGPQHPQVIVADAIVQGPKAAFIRCCSGKGWLPLTDPNGTRICFQHVDEESKVDTSKFEVADGKDKVEGSPGNVWHQ